MESFDFIMDSELQAIAILVDMTEEDVLADYRLYCKYAELPLCFDSWMEYTKETEHNF
jgi:hypothetical protein